LTSAAGRPASFSGKATLSATVLDDSRLKCWKIIPTRRRRARSPSTPSTATSSPSTTTRPPVGFSRPLISRISVDLPAPEAPITPNTSPVFTDSETSLRAACPPVA
jgi:hypothetical protein